MLNVLTAAQTVATDAGAASAIGPLSKAISAFANSPHAVGSVWLISSALFTTYSTTKFLKHEPEEAGSDFDSSSKMKRRKLHLKQPFRPSALFKNRQQESVAPVIKEYNYIIEKFLSLPPPSLLTVYRFGGSLLMGLFLCSPISLAAIVDRWHVTTKVACAFFWPAIFLFTANFMNAIALDRIGISLTYTSKCGIPLMTVLLTALLDGWSALPSVPALLSLIPIALGIGAASWNTPHFELLGFIAAVISTAAQSALNVCSKHAITKTGVGGPAAQRSMVAVGLIITLIYSLSQIIINESHAFKQQKANERTGNKVDHLLHLPPAWLTIMAVTAYHVEYMLSFTFVKLVQPVTYGTCDAIRRLSIIFSGRVLFGGAPLTKLNISGIALALLGALSFSIASSVS